MAATDDPQSQGSLGKTYFDDGEPGIHPQYVFVKNSLGHAERADSLSSKWVLSFNWLDFYPEDNVRDQRLQYLNQDLMTLLRLKHHLFWSNVVFDTSFIAFLDSFLLYARRIGSSRSSENSLLGATSSDSNMTLSPSHRSIMRNVFAVIARMATARESATTGFGSAQAHGDLVYGVLDFPRVLDFVSLFARFNFHAVASIVAQLFTIQPKYTFGLDQTITAATQVVREMARKLSQSLRAALSVAPATTAPASPDAALIDEMHATSEDVATYFVDLVYSLSTFIKIYPGAAASFSQDDDTVYVLSYALRALLPNILLGLGEQQPSLDTLRRHFASRNHTLSIINKIISHLIATCLEASEAAPEMHKAKQQESSAALAHLSELLQALIVPDRKLVSRVAKNREDLKPMAWLLLEEEDQQQADDSLTSSTGLSHTVVSPETFVIIRDLESKYSILPRLEQFCSQMKSAGLDEKSIETSLNEIRVILEKTPASAASSSSYHATTANKQLEEVWQDATRRSTSVKDIFSDLSDGFIVFALVSHYKNDHDRLVHDLLEHNLPPALKSVDRKMSLADAKSKLFGDVNADMGGRFNVDLSNAKLPGKKGKSDTVDFKQALKVQDASKVAASVTAFNNRQQRDLEDYSYQVQLKRARGQYVDEEDADLHEQLTASAEWTAGVAGYEDEPDDSLDDFHPSTHADDDADSRLSRRPLGGARSKFSNSPLLSTRYAASARNEEDDEEDLEAQFAADDAELLPDDNPRSQAPPDHGKQPQSRGPRDQHHQQKNQPQHHKQQQKGHQQAQQQKQASGGNQQPSGGKRSGAPSSSSSAPAMNPTAPSYTPSQPQAQPRQGGRGAPKKTGSQPAHGAESSHPHSGGRGKSQQKGNDSKRGGK